MIIKIREQEIDLILAKDYLYSYIYRFKKKKKLVLSHNEIIIIEDQYIIEFKEMLITSLKDLLRDCYEEPKHKMRSKYPSRYIKIKFEEYIYILDYRADLTGRYASAIFNYIQMIGE